MAAQAPTVRYVLGAAPHEARWQSEAGAPPPSRLFIGDDRLTADAALRKLRSGEHILYTGDFQNARQLLAALGRRLKKKERSAPASSPLLERFRAHRRARAEEHALLNRLLVPLDANYAVALRRGPNVRDACEDVWGPPDARGTVVSLRELLGILGARQWREKGVEVPGLPGRIHAHYGVFTPTRGEYPQLLLRAPAPTGKRVFDVGTGTGVLGLLLLARGAQEVIATDQDPRAVACANENAQRLGFAGRFRAMEADLFPEGAADLIVFNPPWLPEPPKSRMDRAIYDPGGEVLRAFLQRAPTHLHPGGELWLLISDLAELLGLRARGELDALIERSGLTVAFTEQVRPAHSKSRDEADPLHEARASETTTLYCLRPRRVE